MIDRPEAMIRLLKYAWSFAAERVTDLIERFWLPDPRRHDFAAQVLASAPVWSVDVQRVVLSLVRSGLAAYNVDFLAQAARSKRTGCASALIAAELERQRNEAATLPSAEQRGAYVSLI